MRSPSSINNVHFIPTYVLYLPDDLPTATMHIYIYNNIVLYFSTVDALQNLYHNNACMVYLHETQEALTPPITH